MMNLAESHRAQRNLLAAVPWGLAFGLIVLGATSSFRRQQRRAHPHEFFDGDDSNFTGVASGNSFDSISSQGSNLWNATISGVPYRKFNCQSCSDAASLLDPNAPRAIIGGAMKGGTRALLTYLSQHPQVYSEQGKETHLLDNRQDGVLFPLEDINNADEDNNHGGNIDRCLVLNAYQQAFAKKVGKLKGHGNDTLAVGATQEHIFFDKSPAYIVFSHVVPQRVLCAFPNAKIILLLRNPVDRAYSHFQHCHKKYHHEEGCHGRTFEECVDSDLDGLRSAGVLGASTPGEEYEAWVRYHRQKRAKRNMMIAKSLYDIQLRQWFAVFRDHFGDNFTKQFLILESEQMHVNKQDILNRTLDFVGLPHHELVNSQFYHVGDYETMAKETREKLIKFFKPHNERLRQLLSPFGIEISWAEEGAE